MLPCPRDSAVRAAAAAGGRWPIRAGGSCGSSALYRAVCGAVAARHRAARSTCRRSTSPRRTRSSPATGLYFVFGARRVLVGAAATGCRCRCRRCCSRCSPATSSSSRSSIVAGGTFGAPLPILLFPQLAAGGWLLRTQTAFFHAALATRRACSASTSIARSKGAIGGAQLVPDRHHRLRLFRDGRHRGRARPLHQGVGGPRRAARHRRREPRAGQPPHHPGHAGRRAGRRPERRRARPQRAGHAAARRLRPHARRHAPGRVQLDAARLLAALAGGLHRVAAAVQGRGDAAPAARAAGAHRLGPQRRHADLSRGPRARADRRRSR